MKRRSGRFVVAGLAVAVLLPSCTSGDGAADRTNATTTTTTPAPLPEGVLVPGGSIVLGANDAEITSSFDGDAFQLRTSIDDRSVEWVSTVGTHVAGGMPVRCGDAARGPSQPSLDDATKVSGARGHLVVLSDGGMVAITTTSPATLDTHPEGVGRLPRAELTSSVLVTPEQAQQLAKQPVDDPLIVHRWKHEFAGGLVVEGELGGSLARELFYRFRFSGTGQGGVSSDLGGIACNGRRGPYSFADEATYGLVLLAGGAALRVDGVPVTDTVPDPTMQGEWAVAEVTKDQGTAKAEVVDRHGKRIARWTLTYTRPEEAD